MPWLRAGPHEIPKYKCCALSFMLPSDCMCDGFFCASTESLWQFKPEYNSDVITSGCKVPVQDTDKAFECVCDAISAQPSECLWHCEA